MADALAATRDRLADLPEGIWDCEACGATDAMQVRRSSLRPEPCADDISLKCAECYHVRPHGVPVTRESYESEMDERGRRTVDAVDDGPDSVEENLAALGYIDY